VIKRYWRRDPLLVYQRAVKAFVIDDDIFAILDPDLGVLA
jgi:hypothetical protein